MSSPDSKSGTASDAFAEPSPEPSNSKLRPSGASPRANRPPDKPSAPRPDDDLDPGRYEGHLAEFPCFILDKRRRDQFGNNPLVYTDVIAPNDEPIQRRWEAWPGRFGIGGPSAAEVFYELVQLYVEQGAHGRPHPVQDSQRPLSAPSPQYSEPRPEGLRPAPARPRHPLWLPLHLRERLLRPRAEGLRPHAGVGALHRLDRLHEKAGTSRRGLPVPGGAPLRRRRRLAGASHHREESRPLLHRLRLGALSNPEAPRAAARALPREDVRLPDHA